MIKEKIYKYNVCNESGLKFLLVFLEVLWEGYDMLLSIVKDMVFFICVEIGILVVRILVFREYTFVFEIFFFFDVIIIIILWLYGD